MKLDVGLQDLIEVDGNWVERDALKVAEELEKIDPNIKIFCIDPMTGPGINDAPFIVAELCPDGRYRRIFEAWKLDRSVVDRVRAADTHSGFNPLDEIDAVKRIVEGKQRRRYEDEMASKKDLVAAIARNKKNSFSYREENTGDKVTIYPDRPSKREVVE